MKITIIGSGRIGLTEGQLLSKAGYEIMYGSRNPNRIDLSVFKGNVQAESVPNASQFAQIILIAIPWVALEETAKLLQPTDNKIIIDATNPFKRSQNGFGIQKMPEDMTALQFTERFFPKASVVKSFNTLTAGFQFSSAGRTGTDRVIMPLAGDDLAAKKVISQVIEDAGFIPYDIGDAQMSKFIEPPRGAYSLYGEEWQADTIDQAMHRLKQGQTHS